MSAEDKISCFVDRIEGDVAVLLLDDGAQELRLSAAALPDGVGEGRWLKLHLEADPTTDAERAEALRSLRERLLER